MTSNTTDDLLTPSEAAKYLKLSKYSLREWRRRRRAGDLVGPEYIRIGHKTIRYSIADLEKFAQSMKPAAE